MEPSPLRNPGFEHLRQPHDGNCWWCGAKASTSEHKYKRTDLARLGAGGDLYWGGDPTRPYIVKSLRKDPAVRFSKSLCAPCNNARSQPFDRSYDVYRDYVWNTLDRLWHRKRISMSDVYGHDWPERQMDLARYFAKHLGCRLVDEGLPPPMQMSKFLSGATSMPALRG
jgi:hypothetical protein